MNGDVNIVAVSGQSFVNGVIHHLKHHVMQAGAIIGITDIHPRALSNGVKPFENLDIFGAIF
jgi:hypothetical protein